LAERAAGGYGARVVEVVGLGVRTVVVGRGKVGGGRKVGMVLTGLAGAGAGLL
jgi:hypothetical protein